MHQETKNVLRSIVQEGNKKNSRHYECTGAVQSTVSAEKQGKKQKRERELYSLYNKRQWSELRIKLDIQHPDCIIIALKNSQKAYFNKVISIFNLRLLAFFVRLLLLSGRFEHDFELGRLCASVKIQQRAERRQFEFSMLYHLIFNQGRGSQIYPDHQSEREIIGDDEKK